MTDKVDIKVDEGVHIHKHKVVEKENKV